MTASTACARTLVDELVRAGLTDAVLAPGSRSAPLALALADDERIRLHVHLDERSAAFFAVGAAKAAGRPTLVLCTSGTAGAHFHPAVLEADHSRVPLIVCTADRPAELRHTGAPQTTDQVHLYGEAVRFFADIPADGDPAARAAWRPIAARVWAEAAGPPAGPVHLNVAFREPLIPPVAGRAGPPASWRSPAGRVDVHGSYRTGGAGAAGRTTPPPALTERILAAERGLVVAGWGSPPEAHEVAFALRWPLLADAISGQRDSGDAVTTYEALLRVPGFAGAHRPDLVIRFGGPLTSKSAMAWLDASVPQILVDPDGGWLDPHRTAAERVPSLPDLRPLPGGGPRYSPAVDAWYGAWLRAEETARPALDAFLDADDDPFEGRVARDVAAVCATRRDGARRCSSLPACRCGTWKPSPAGCRIASTPTVASTGSTASSRRSSVSPPAVGAVPQTRPAGPWSASSATSPFSTTPAGSSARRPAASTPCSWSSTTPAAGSSRSFPRPAYRRTGSSCCSAPPRPRTSPRWRRPTALRRSGWRGPPTSGRPSSGLWPPGECGCSSFPTGDRTANVDRHRRAWAAVAEAMAKFRA